MITTADEMSAIIADFRAKHPRSRDLRYLCALAKEKRTQQLMAELDVLGGPLLASMRRKQHDETVLCHMTEMLQRCVEEDIAAFGE